MPRSARRFDAFEVALVSLLVALAAAAIAVGLVRPDPAAHLRRAFGPSHWSHGPEEWIVRDVFGSRRGGVFVDVGAADARTGSNTYFLEHELGWSGIAIDALAEYAGSYEQFRPNTRFFAFFVGAVSDETATIFVDPNRRESSSSDPAFAEAYSSTGDLSARQVPTIALDDLLPRLGIERVDFVSMDIELSEPEALSGFDLARFRPSLICVEQHAALSQWLVDYFAQRGYTPIVEYLWIDRENLWFRPGAAS